MKFLKYLIIFSIISASAFAEEGRIIKIHGDNTAYLKREGQKIILANDSEIETGDEIFSEGSVLVFHLFPATQISMSKHSQIKIDKNLIEESADKEKNFSVIGFIKGIIRLNVTKDPLQEIDQKVEAQGVAFAVRGTDYELAMTDDEVDLDVYEGAVEVSSPYVQTFVPEIVKKGKAFRFNRKQKNFGTKKFGSRFKDHPGFINKDELKQKWKAAKVVRQMKREERMKLREERKNARRDKKSRRVKSKR